MKPYAAFTVEGDYKHGLETLLEERGLHYRRGKWWQEGMVVQVSENGLLARLVMRVFLHFFGPGMQANRAFAVAETLMRQPASETERGVLADYLDRPLTPHYTHVIMLAANGEPAKQVYDTIRNYLCAERAVFSDSRRWLKKQGGGGM